MDKTIKTRDVVKDIKVLDKKAAGLAAVRDIHTKIKEVAERRDPPSRQQRHGADYAQSKVEQGARGTTCGVRRSGVDGTRKATDAARNAHKAVKDARQVAANTMKPTIKQGTSGHQRQDYLIKSALHQELVVIGNGALFRKLDGTLGELVSELKRIEGIIADDVLPEPRIKTLIEILDSLHHGECGNDMGDFIQRIL